MRMGEPITADILSKISEYEDDIFAKFTLVGIVKDCGDDKYLILDLNKSKRLLDDGEFRLLQVIKNVKSDDLMSLFRRGKTVYEDTAQFRNAVEAAANNIYCGSDLEPKGMLVPIRRYTVFNNTIGYGYLDFNTLKYVVSKEEIRPSIVINIFLNVASIELLSILTEGEKEFVDSLFLRKLGYKQSIEEVLNRRIERIELCYKAKDAYRIKKIGNKILDRLAEQKASEVLKERARVQTEGADVVLVAELIYGDRGGIIKNELGKILHTGSREGFIGRLRSGEEVLILPKIASFEQLKSISIENATVSQQVSIRHGKKVTTIRLNNGVVLPKIQIGIKGKTGWKLASQWDIPELMESIKYKA